MEIVSQSSIVAAQTSAVSSKRPERRWGESGADDYRFEAIKYSFARFPFRKVLAKRGSLHHAFSHSHLNPGSIQLEDGTKRLSAAMAEEEEETREFREEMKRKRLAKFSVRERVNALDTCPNSHGSLAFLGFISRFHHQGAPQLMFREFGLVDTSVQNTSASASKGTKQRNEQRAPPPLSLSVPSSDTAPLTSSVRGQMAAGPFAGCYVLYALYLLKGNLVPALKPRVRM